MPGTRIKDYLGALSLRIIVPVLITILLFAFTMYFWFLPNQENILMQEKRAKVRELTQAVISLLEEYDARVQDGELSLAEAQERAKTRIGNMRYGPEEKDYFWINDMHPRMIYHPYRTDLNGHDISGFADPHGTLLFLDMVKVVKEQGEGYVDYMWQWKDDAELIVPKISFVKGFKPWGWIVGTGIYIEDVKAETDKLARNMLLTGLSIILIVLVLSAYIIRESAKTSSERRKFELELEKSLESYQSLFESASDAFLLLKENRVTLCNVQSLLLFGYENQDELIGKFPWDFSPPVQPDGTDSRTKSKEVIEKALVLHEPQRFLWKHRRTNGELFDAEVSLSCHTFKGEEYILSIIRDISARTKALELLEKAHDNLEKRITEISELNKDLEAFDYSVSNALRVPIRHIEGFCYILNDKAGHKLSGEDKKFLNKITNSTIQLREMVDALLKLSRASRERLSIEKFNLSYIADSIARNLAKDNPGVAFDITIEEGIEVEGDVQLMHIVMFNLLDNAFKYASTVDKPAIRFGKTNNARETIFFVSDNGSGIEPDRLDKLFTPFHSFHSDSDFEGIGLGLATAAKIINRHHGRIWAENNPGGGTVLYFTLGRP